MKLHQLLKYFSVAFLFEAVVAGSTYLNSTLLSSLNFSDTHITIFFILESLLALVIISSQAFIKKEEIKKRASYILLAQGCLMFLVSSLDPYLAPLSLLIALSSLYVTWICFDVFIEEETKSSETGRIRGLYFTILNAAWLIAPYLSTRFISITDNFSFLFQIYACLLCAASLFLFAIRRNTVWKNHKNPLHTHESIKTGLTTFLINKDLLGISLLSVLLHTFYGIFVLFLTPILMNEISIPLSIISYIIPIMILPFVLFQEIFGWLADKFMGEKTILMYGLLLMTFSLFAVPFMNILPLMGVIGFLFMSRVGASAYEIMLESFFFKKVSDKHLSTHTSLYRATRPLGYLITSIIAFVVLYNNPGMQLSSIFPIIGCILLLGIVPWVYLKDTKPSM